jgi:hypothetical protein
MELGDVPKVRFGATVTPLPGAAESGGTVVTVARHGSSAADSRPPHLLGMGKPTQRYFKFASSTSFTNHFLKGKFRKRFISAVGEIST